MLSIPRLISRFGVVVIPVVMTVLSVSLSLLVAWLLCLVIAVPNTGMHMFFAFIIPLVVTPMLSFATSLSIRDLQKARRQANEMALVDPLTGIANRRAFFDAIDRRAETARTTSCIQGVLFIDIDHFKDINDRWGHAAGDAVLKDFADLLKASMRDTDLIARIGGEEFVVHMLAATPSGLAATAAGIGAKVRSHMVVFEGRTLRYTVSIGVAIGGGMDTIDQLLPAADRALYSVKNSGRDGYSVAPLDNAAEPAVNAGGGGPLRAPASRVRVA